ncbi:hypothetical protein RJT34_18535 [Clitoria ternatea]|uniref:Uncharacterized protein n=1 Tax=Clitoria ternatea TaxID=43366 RepID=A0AAN9PFI7_CLITE
MKALCPHPFLFVTLRIFPLWLRCPVLPFTSISSYFLLVLTVILVFSSLTKASNDQVSTQFSWNTNRTDRVWKYGHPLGGVR